MTRTRAHCTEVRPGRSGGRMTATGSVGAVEAGLWAASKRSLQVLSIRQEPGAAGMGGDGIGLDKTKPIFPKSSGDQV